MLSVYDIDFIIDQYSKLVILFLYLTMEWTFIHFFLLIKIRLDKFGIQTSVSIGKGYNLQSTCIFVKSVETESLKLERRKLSLVDQRFRSLHLRAKIIIIEIIEKMTDFDRNVSELVNDVNYSAKNPVLKLGIRFLFPIWFGMMAYIVWALVGKLESVSDY